MSERDFAGIYDPHVSQIYGFFGYLLPSLADAEDLTQQTFERALRAWRSYDESRGSVTSWLFAIARNLFIDHMRASGGERLTVVDAGELESLMETVEPRDPGLDPDLERALDDLNQRERELIALRFGGDLTGREIAEMTGLTYANVQQILSRSLRRMRASLESRSAGEKLPVGAGS